MVIPIFIHKHDQQIPRTMEWSRGAVWLLCWLCTVCLRMWSVCLLWITAVALECLFLLQFPLRFLPGSIPIPSAMRSTLSRIVRLFRIHSSSIQFKSIHGVWMRTLWASSIAPLHRTLTLPTYVCHSLRKALVALHSTIQKIPKWVCFAVEWVLDYER